jgi:hypothetical protein
MGNYSLAVVPSRLISLLLFVVPSDSFPPAHAQPITCLTSKLSPHTMYLTPDSFPSIALYLLGRVEVTDQLLSFPLQHTPSDVIIFQKINLEASTTMGGHDNVRNICKNQRIPKLKLAVLCPALDALKGTPVIVYGLLFPSPTYIGTLYLIPSIHLK